MENPSFNLIEIAHMFICSQQLNRYSINRHGGKIKDDLPPSRCEDAVSNLAGRHQERAHQ